MTGAEGFFGVCALLKKLTLMTQGYIYQTIAELSACSSSFSILQATRRQTRLAKPHSRRSCHAQNLALRARELVYPPNSPQILLYRR
jgi:hypothetical protein